MHSEVAKGEGSLPLSLLLRPEMIHYILSLLEFIFFFPPLLLALPIHFIDLQLSSELTSPARLDNKLYFNYNDVELWHNPQ
jgi:hypothetical protein